MGLTVNANGIYADRFASDGTRQFGQSISSRSISALYCARANQCSFAGGCGQAREGDCTLGRTGLRIRDRSSLLVFAASLAAVRRHPATQAGRSPMARNLGLRLIRDRIDASEDGDSLSVITTALNPKAFIYCLAIVPAQVRPYELGFFWIVLLVTTAATGSMWLLLGRRLNGGRELADRVAGAALIAFALLLLRPLIVVAAT